jgi:hypothetical protein
MECLILIQNIHTSWSKKSRGGKLAIERNAVPDALAIPVGQLKKSVKGLIEHSASYYESHGFSSPHHASLTQESAGRLRLHGLVIEPVGAQLKVTLEYDSGRAGMPLRYAPLGGIPSTRMHLQSGQWGRVLYNGRFTHDEADWWYEKQVFNIGLVEKLKEDIFIATQPTQVISQMARLW